MLSNIAGLFIAIAGVVAGILALLSDELKENKRLKYILVGVLVVLSVYAMIGSLFAFSNVPDSNSQGVSLRVPIAISANQGWQSSRISVSKGDTISVIVLFGKWTTQRFEMPEDIKQTLPDYYKDLEIFGNNQYEQGGEGVDKSCVDYHVQNCPVPNAPWGALVARIEESTPVAIGKSNDFVAPQNGEIFFNINDDTNELYDNFGVLAIKIGVK
jgi:hypothetical protein